LCNQKPGGGHRGPQQKLFAQNSLSRWGQRRALRPSGKRANLDLRMVHEFGWSYCHHHGSRSALTCPCEECRARLVRLDLAEAFPPRRDVVIEAD